MIKHLLVIDDEPLLQVVVQAALEDIAGWDVGVAGSGEEGVAIALTTPLDAILLDVSMPDMDGIETFQQLQQQPQTREIPVVFLTAKVQPADKVRFAELGIRGVVTKPFDPMTLADEVARILGWAR
ncbi:MAG: response regulator [Oculatellaceae cyanobacterium Prado106]|nr:response regulator [Oculatellaceae cyanobacterium Prado106]